MLFVPQHTVAVALWATRWGGFSAQGALHSEAATKTAGDEARTRDVHLGKVVLYQLSYTRI